MTAKTVAFSRKVGDGKNRVVVYADPFRNNRLTLRWRQDGNWKRETLGRSVEIDRRGSVTACDDPSEDIVAWAVSAAMKKSLELSGALPSNGKSKDARAQKELTIAEAEALITDPEVGKYPHPSAFRDELARSLRFAAAVWGADKSWASIEESDWTRLLRRRLEQLLAKNAKGVRATEITIGRLITTVIWLRRKKHIARDAASWPDDWKQEITDHWKGVTKSSREPMPERPRHTLEEAQAILRASAFDPRFHLLMWLGMELRLGQVVRTRRSDLVLSPIEGANYGTATIHGAGKKGGTVVVLTKGQRAVLDAAMGEGGYLHHLEERYPDHDYLLFPAGYIAGRVGRMRGKETTFKLSEKASTEKPATSSWIRKNFRVAEEKAGVVHQNGRGAYGVRRVSVDVAKEQHLSVHALQAAGGWSDTKMPLTVYAESANEAGQREAQPFRAHLRGEDKE